MTGTNCDLFTHKSSRSYLNHLVYGYKIWSLTFRKECRLMVFENRVLRTFGLKRYEVTREWRKLHNKQLYVLYSSPNIIRVINQGD
jgi:hypothetical protein